MRGVMAMGEDQIQARNGNSICHTLRWAKHNRTTTLLRTNGRRKLDGRGDRGMEELRATRPPINSGVAGERTAGIRAHPEPTVQMLPETHGRWFLSRQGNASRGCRTESRWRLGIRSLSLPTVWFCQAVSRAVTLHDETNNHDGKEGPLSAGKTESFSFWIFLKAGGRNVVKGKGSRWFSI
jgi:hypothetical protein